MNDLPDSSIGSPSPNRNGSNPRSRTRRILRGRVACIRCQRRKIRCDGVLPSCGSCLKAGVQCVDGGKMDGVDSPRAYISSLKSRVTWLESIVRANCPNVDLSQGPGTQNESSHDDIADENIIAQNNSSLPVPHDLECAQDVGTTLHPDRAATIVPQIQELSSNSNERQSGLAHEIGLVSLSAGSDPKYIGPSSGYFFAKLLLACAKQNQRNAPLPQIDRRAESLSERLFPRGILSVPPTPLPEAIDDAIKISEAYFDTIHLQYPFLHRPSHMKLIEHVYGDTETSPVAIFQVYMVLAIGAAVLSRRLKISLPGDGFCASAMKHFDKFSIENSLKGLHCILLLLVYTLRSSSMGLNVWYLNYQCIAALLDLGLQRDVRSGKTMSILDQELRTRTFWVIYSLDRSVATMMGRPIGLRDEACELRLPADVDDNKLSVNSIQPRLEAEQPTHMSCAIHLFKLAQLNSEMKYVLHSISHKAPPYAYPNIPDMLRWQSDIAARLQTWFDQIPQFSGDKIYLTKICEIKYHDIVMLLFRPSPAIPSPSIDSLTQCYESATASIRLYDQLYKDDLLVYSWITIHSVFLSTITMLHCIWTVPEVSAQIKLDVLMADLKAGSNVLSATGEHWSAAKRSRNVLDELSGTTIRWIVESRTGDTDIEPFAAPRRRDVGSSMGSIIANPSQDEPVQNTHHQTFGNNGDTQVLEPFHGSEDFGSNFFIPLFGDGNLADQIDFTDPAAVNAIMHGIFTDFQPVYDLGQDFDLDSILRVQS